MSRMISIVSISLILGLAIGARVHKAAHASIDADLSDSLSNIATRYMTNDDVEALVELDAPKDELIKQIDDLETEVRTECNQESSNFQQWLSEEEGQLANDNAELNRQKGLLDDANRRISTLTAQAQQQQSQQDDLTQQIKDSNDALATLQQQLQSAIDLRQASHDQNMQIIKQHQDALNDITQLAQLVNAISTNSKTMIKKKLDSLSVKVSKLHKQASSVSHLVNAVKESLDEIKSSDPKADIKKKLLDLIQNIANSIQNSLTLYQNEETQAQQEFDSVTRSNLQGLINTKKQHISDLQDAQNALAQQQIQTNADLDKALADQDSANSQITSLNNMIQSLSDDINKSTSNHNDKLSQCKSDLDDLETMRQFIADNIKGMTPGINCHPQDLTCPRCLYDQQCQNGQVCSDHGMCSPPPQPQDYFQLIPNQIPAQRNNRVDQGIVPQSSFQKTDFTYVFSYIQTAPANGWNNLFNVVDFTGQDHWPFPNQAAVFRVGNLIEIDICRNGPHPQSYYYFNLNLPQTNLNAVNIVAMSVSASTKSAFITWKSSGYQVSADSTQGFQGDVHVFPGETAVFVAGTGYTPVSGSFKDFRRFDRALSKDEVNQIIAAF